ncbi:MAG: FkbM family methyltransferase, partial [Bacteroidota bacterium]|nr:FkbM family methyltransferase [Bacteroidota bacterium]
FFSCYYPNATIKAYEPNKSSFLLLQKNVLKNKLKQIEIFQNAVAGSNKKMYPLKGFKDYSLNQSFLITDEDNEEDIEAISILNLLDLVHFDVIKLDIEGMEIEVLDALIDQKKLVNVHYWIIEFHNNNKIQDYLNVFREEGFKYFTKENIYHFKLN